MTASITWDTARAWVNVDLGALAANARAFEALVRTPILPVVKADAYGLGVAPVVRALEPAAPWGYAVGTPEEGEELRRLGISRPVLVLTPMLPALAPRLAASDLRPSIGDLEALEAWLALGDLPFHLELDTGMTRSGVPWNDPHRLERLGRILAGARGWEGAFTHFHSAETDPVATRLQWARLQEALIALGRRPRWVHAANSGAGVQDLGLGGDLARPGIYLYGGRIGGHQPLPVVSLHARVVAVHRIAREGSVSYHATWRAARPTTIATVAAGYADGVPFTLGNVGRIELNGALHPVVGRVTMDMTMVDVGDAAVATGDVATIYGGRVSFDEQAEAAGTIGYDLLTSLGPRVVRRYRSDP